MVVLLTVNQAASILGWSRAQLANQAHRGVVPMTRTNPGMSKATFVIDQRALREWMRLNPELVAAGRLRHTRALAAPTNGHAHNGNGTNGHGNGHALIVPQPVAPPSDPLVQCLIRIEHMLSRLIDGV